MLGHSNLRATEIYTQVSIRKLKDIHTATHPGAVLRKPRTEEPGQDDEPDTADLLDALAKEADDEMPE
jgi:integrase/recombinase XerD